VRATASTARTLRARPVDLRAWAVPIDARIWITLAPGGLGSAIRCQIRPVKSRVPSWPRWTSLARVPSRCWLRPVLTLRPGPSDTQGRTMLRVHGQLCGHGGDRGGARGRAGCLLRRRRVGCGFGCGRDDGLTGRHVPRAPDVEVPANHVDLPATLLEPHHRDAVALAEAADLWGLETSVRLFGMIVG
jgi:hypothetical protein